MTALGRYLTTKEAAERLGVTTTHVRRLVAAGRLRGMALSDRMMLVEAGSVKTFKRRPVGRPRTKKPSKSQGRG